MEKEAAMRDFATYLNPMKVRLLAQAGLDILEAGRDGASIRDADGRQLIDCVSSAGTFNAGRRNPALVRALCRAAEELDLGNFLLCSKEKAALARRLAEITPGELRVCMFGSSGGEIVDFAIKLARGATGRPGIVSAERSYHGHTGFALAAIGREAYRAPFEPLAPGFTRVPFGELAAMEAAVGPETAAVLLEPIQGEGGIRVPPPGYLAAVASLCRERGALLVLDEIQTGLGRTGSLFACEQEGLVPDIITLGKSLSGGLYPISAAVFREDLADFLIAHPFVHLSTFGGADLGCAVALAAIDWIMGHDLAGHATRMGERFSQGFRRLRTRYPETLLEYRGRGLMMGLQFSDPSHGPRASLELARRGVLAIYTGNDPSVMRLQPPLVISAREVDQVLDALDGTLAALAPTAAGGRRDADGD